MIEPRSRLLRLIFTVLALCVFQVITRAQTPIEADWRCSFDGPRSNVRVYFSSEEQAQQAVAKIIRYTGLMQNFVVGQADVANAEAFVENRKRIILYSKAFLRRLVENSRTDWAATGVMAHEIGHHLLGHTLQADEDPNMELEADQFAGFILQKMGASIEEAQAGWKDFASEQASRTHPAKYDRLAAVRRGWVNARDLKPLSEAPSMQPVPSKSTFNEIWFVSMSKAHNFPQRYCLATNLSNNDAIQANWKADYYITSVAAGDNRWVVIMDKSKPNYTDQAYKVSSSFPEDWISEKWKAGYRITSASNGQKSWMIVMTQGTEYGMQTYTIDESFPSDWVTKKWADGYKITSLATDADKYMVVMSQGSEYTRQAYRISEKLDSEWIKTKWDEDYYITSVAKHGDFWAVVMSKGTAFTNQSYWLTKEFPREWIREKWGKGYDISAIH